MVAIRLGVILALVGILWQAFQMVFGTLEQRKFLVGTITKWFLFLACLTFYPGISRGLYKFAIQMGSYVSGSSIKEITDEFGAYLEALEKALKTEEDTMTETITNLTNQISKTSFDPSIHSNTTSPSGGYYFNDNYYLLESQLYSAEKKKQELDSIIASIDTDHPKGVARTINSLKSVLIIDDTDITRKYKLDLSMKDSSGNDTGFLSPNAMLRMSVIGAQIMWENTWQNDIVTKWEENAENNWILKKNITDFPFDRIFDLILCFVAEILEVVITCIELIQYVMCIIEFVICITFGIVLIPCLLFDGLKDMAMKLIPSLLSQTVKLAMITICMFFCCYTYLDITKTIISDTSAFNIWMFCYVVFTILLTFALCSNAPKLATALLTGQPQMSMGEFVQSAAAIAGGAKLAQAAATRTVGAGKAAIGNATRATANRLGDVAAMAGGARAAFNDAQARGLGGVASRVNGLGGAIKAGARRTGSRIAGGMQNAATTWGNKGRGGGMGGGSGIGGNQFDVNQRGKGVGMNKDNQSQFRRDYAGHQNEQNNQSSLKEYLSSQYKDGFMGEWKDRQTGKNATPHPDSPVSGNVVTGNNFNPPAAFGGAGGLAPSPTPRPPMGGGGSSVSYSPPALPDYSDEGLAKLKSANID